MSHLGLGAVEGIFFAVVVLGFAAWQLWDVRKK